MQVQAAQWPQPQSVSCLFLSVITWIDCCVDYVLTVRLSGVPVVLRSVHHVVLGHILHMFLCICNFCVLNELLQLWAGWNRGLAETAVCLWPTFHRPAENGNSCSCHNRLAVSWVVATLPFTFAIMVVHVVDKDSDLTITPVSLSLEALWVKASGSVMTRRVVYWTQIVAIMMVPIMMIPVRICLHYSIFRCEHILWWYVQYQASKVQVLTFWNNVKEALCTKCLPR